MNYIWYKQGFKSCMHELPFLFNNFYYYIKNHIYKSNKDNTIIYQLMDDIESLSIIHKISCIHTIVVTVMIVM